MEVNCWIRRSGIESAMDTWEGNTDSGMFEVGVEELNGGTGGKGRGGCRCVAVESGVAPSAVDCSGESGMRGRSQSAGGMVGTGNSM